MSNAIAGHRTFVAIGDAFIVADCGVITVIVIGPVHVIAVVVARRFAAVATATGAATVSRAQRHIQAVGAIACSCRLCGCGHSRRAQYIRLHCGRWHAAVDGVVLPIVLRRCRHFIRTTKAALGDGGRFV